MFHRETLLCLLFFFLTWEYLNRHRVAREWKEHVTWNDIIHGVQPEETAPPRQSATAADENGRQRRQSRKKRIQETPIEQAEKTWFGRFHPRVLFSNLFGENSAIVQILNNELNFINPLIEFVYGYVELALTIGQDVSNELLAIRTFKEGGNFQIAAVTRCIPHQDSHELFNKKSTNHFGAMQDHQSHEILPVWQERKEHIFKHTTSYPAQKRLRAQEKTAKFWQS